MKIFIEMREKNKTTNNNKIYNKSQFRIQKEDKRKKKMFYKEKSKMNEIDFSLTL